MKKQLFLVAMVFVMVAGKSQQDPQFTHFMFDKLSINPGFAGTNEAYCFTGIWRNQWSGLGDEPKTVLINAHAPVDFVKGGLGLTYFNDKLGWFNSNFIRLSYSYHIKNLGPGTLGVGISAGYFTHKINPQWITPDVAASIDGAIPTSTNIEGNLDFSLGAYYYASNFYAGISSTHLSEANLKTLNVKAARHYYFMGGYSHPVLNGDLDIKPNVLVKSDLASTQFDANLTVMYLKKFWAGVTWRNKDAWAPLLGYQHSFNKFGTLKVGYSYDVTTSDISNYSNGSHEIMVNYCFNIVIPKVFERSVHPRFL